MKIAVHTIAKNELANVKGWLESAADADWAMMVDTGSTDGTPLAFIREAALMKHARAQFKTYSICVQPFRFDTARNTALALLPADIDVVLTVDMDERLQPGWREAIEAVWQPGVHHSGGYRYIFARNPDGSIALEFNHNRLHSRHNFHWVLPAHEAPYPYLLEGPEAKVFIPGLVVEQKQDRTLNRADRDLPLVELGWKENPHSQRALFYYARQLHYAGRHAEAIPLLNQYFAMGETFPWEAAAAADCLAACWRMKK